MVCGGVFCVCSSGGGPPCWQAKADSVFQGHGWLCAGSLGQGMDPAGGLVSEVLQLSGKDGKSPPAHLLWSSSQPLSGHIPLFHFFHDYASVFHEMTCFSFSRIFKQQIPLPHNHCASFPCFYYRHKNKIYCFQFCPFFSAALAPSLLGFSPVSGQSPVPLLLNSELLPACWDHDGENKVPCLLEEERIKHCNTMPEPLEMDFETCS